MNKITILIQKEQNVKKTFFVFLFFVFINSFSQEKIIGNFYIKAKMNYGLTKFKFDNDGIFQMKINDGLEIQNYGSGHYYIKKDSLYLDYDLTELKEKSYHRTKYFDSNKDSTTIKIRFLGKENKPVKNTLIDLRDNPPYFKAKKTDKNGIVIFKLKKKRRKVVFFITHEDYGDYEFKVWLHYNNIIDVYLHNSFGGLPIKKYFAKYKIKNITKDVIELKSNDKLLSLKRYKE